MITTIENHSVLRLMHVEVRSRGQDHVELRNWGVQMATEALQRFHNHVRKVIVRVQDLNGPKGGIDKHVSVSLHMEGGGTKRIRQRAGSYEAAIGMALGRAKRVLQRCQHVGSRKHRLRHRGAL